LRRKLIWAGFLLGSFVGGYLPSLWGGEALSFTGVALSFAGAVAGIVLGARIGRSA
jgi:hypothetical protein